MNEITHKRITLVISVMGLVISIVLGWEKIWSALLRFSWILGWGLLLALLGFVVFIFYEIFILTISIVHDFLVKVNKFESLPKKIREWCYHVAIRAELPWNNMIVVLTLPLFIWGCTWGIIIDPKEVCFDHKFTSTFAFIDRFLGPRLEPRGPLINLWPGLNKPPASRCEVFVSSIYSGGWIVVAVITILLVFFLAYWLMQKDRDAT